MKKFFIYSISVIVSLCVTSCDSYLDINYDPNAPGESVIDNDMVMPSIEMALCSQYGNFYRTVGAYLAEQYCHAFGTSNYLDYSQFIVSSTRTSSAYSVLMTGCVGNASAVLEKAEANEDWGTYLAATCLRSFAFQAMADAYGEIPYTEAMDKSNLNPHYDDGQTIYSGLLGELDNALSKVSPNSDVATSFLYPGMNATSWIKFANALKLKLLMRESSVASVDAQIANLIAEGNFPDEDVAFADCWQDASGKANPFYQEEFALYFGSTQINCALNVALAVVMNSSNDARRDAFFSPNKDGKFWGCVSGTNISNNQENYGLTSFCRPNMKYNTPVCLITKSEIEFFISEYFAKKGDNGNAEKHYQSAIESSFVSAGLSATDAASVLAAWPYDQANYAKCIGIQKWVALAGVNNFEAWCEMRRLGYPDFGPLDAHDIYADKKGSVLDESKLEPGTLYTPIQYNTEVGKSSLAQRWPYPTSSVNANANAPAVRKMNEKVFWAK